MPGATGGLVAMPLAYSGNANVVQLTLQPAMRRIPIAAGGGTVYLVAQSTFTGGAQSVYGAIFARRRR